MPDDIALIESDIDTYLDLHERKELLRFVTIGSVDDGKSTLIGRLLHDTGSVFLDQLEAVRQASRQGQAAFDGLDLSLITDGLKAEREQGITIDVAYRYFTTPKRKFIIADTPGHEQYTRNMATGASTADVALILIDARYGVLSQSRRHACIASLLGIPNLVVCVNKLDLKDYSQAVYERIVADFRAFARDLDFSDIACIPVSALTGVNVVESSDRTPWYEGPTVLEYLETVPIQRSRNYQGFALPVQQVLRPDLHFRGYAGTIACGTVKPGDEVVVLPSGRTTRVDRIVTLDGDLDEAFPPLSVTLTLADEVDISRGDLIASPNQDLAVSRSLIANLVWMHERPLEPGRQYFIRHAASMVPGAFTRLRHRLDIASLSPEAADNLGLNEIGQVELHLSRPLVTARYADIRELGAFIVVDRESNLTVGAGMITGHGEAEVLDRDLGTNVVSPEDRARRFGQRPAVLWLTGEPGTGKTLLARALERRLFDAGHLPYVLDRERVPKADVHGTGVGLSHIIDAARLAKDMGLVVIVAFTAPAAYDRRRAREHLGADGFLEVRLQAPEQVRRGRLRDSDRDPDQAVVAYEPPTAPDLVLDTGDLAVEREVDRLTALLRQHGLLR